MIWREIIRKITSILVLVPLLVILEGFLFSQGVEIVKVGEWGTGAYLDVFIQGDFAFCAAHGAGLDIFDIRDPSNPVMVGNCDTPGNAYGVYVSGNYAYVADWTSGLQIINVTTPASPTLAGSFDTPGSAHELYVSGNYAYVADYGSGLQVIDVTTPSSPTLAGSFDTGEAHGVYVSGNYAYVVGYPIGLKIIDVTTPASPTLAGSYDTPGYFAYEVNVSGNYAYVAAESGGLQVIDVTTPSSPTLAGSYYHPPGIAKGVSVSGNYAYIALKTRGMKIINITNPASPTLAAHYDKEEGVDGVYVSGNFAYIALGSRGLEIIDVTTPSSPTMAGTRNYDTAGFAYGVYVSGNYAYLTKTETGLQVIDITTPSSPTLAGSYNTPGDAQSVHVSGNYAYVADRSEGLQIIDVTIPSSPTLEGSLDTVGYAQSVHVSGNYAYVSHTNPYRLEIIDVTNPATPTLAGSYNMEAGPRGVYVSGNYAYVADNLKGIKIIDVTVPTSPVLAGSYNDYPDRAKGVYVSGHYAYVADYLKGLQIIDVTTPASPTLAGSYNTPGNAVEVYVSDNYAYVAVGISELQIIDVTTPLSPTLAGSYDTAGDTYGVYVSGNYAYVADGSSGKLYILLIQLLNQSILTLSSGTGGTTDPTPGTYKYENGTAVKIIATPDSGYTFTGWTGDVPLGHGNDNPLSITIDSNKSLIANFSSLTTPVISLSTSVLNFGATTSGDKTSEQQLRISNGGEGVLSWNVTDDAGWLSYDPTAGTDAGIVKVSVNLSGQTPGTYIGTISLIDPNASNSPQTVAVTLTVKDLSDCDLPFGSYDTPIDGTSGITGAIPVTGWVLDDIGVESVKVYRNPVEGEDTEDLIYIGDAMFVEGARADVEQAYPDYPQNYQAGWGYMMLTNFLPGQGNGTFQIHAYATDKDGHSVSLGTKTIHCDNANAIKPFGAIDTPTQGGTVSGSFFNSGWALTPLPNNIPIDGSTINVWVDGVRLGNPAYNQFRNDIATLFPGYENTDGAVGAYYLDTTTYENGVHTIAWSVRDNAGNSDGIGSRFFTIANTGGSAQTSVQSHKDDLRPSMSYETILNMPVNFDQVKHKKGYRKDIEPRKAMPDEYGQTTFDIKEVERIEIELGKGVSIGFMVVGEELRPLPFGSTLDTKKGIFYWQPGPGFIGVYDLVFIKLDEFGVQRRINVKIKIRPKFGMLRMDLKK